MRDFHFRLEPRWGAAYARSAGPAAAAEIHGSLRPRRERAPDEDVAPALWPRPSDRALGRLARAGRMAWKLCGILLSALLWFHAVFIGVTSILVLCYRWMDPPVTVLMFYRKFETGYSISRPQALRLEDLGRRRRDMLIRVEDWSFYRHHGFDLGAIRDAWKLNEKRGRPVSGASTLSMQTARTLFLVPVKSYLRKYLEAIVTVELEIILGKDRILELYYYAAEWGRGVFGIQAASRRAYGAPVTRISDEKYMRLIALLPSPLRFGPDTLFNHRTLAWRYDYLVDRYMPKPAPTDEAPEALPAASPQPAAD